MAALVCAAGLLSLRFDDDVVRTLRSSSVHYTDLIQYQADTGRDPNDTLVLVEAGSRIDAELLERARSLHVELALTEGVAGVFSAFSLREIGSLTGDTPPLVPDDLAGVDIAALLDRVRAHPLSLGRAVSADQTTMLLVLAADRQVAPRQRLAAVESTVAALEGPGLEITVIGLEKTRIELADALKRDQILLNGGGTLLSFLVALFFFRSLRYAAIAFAPGLVALLWLLGGAGLVGMPIGIVSSIVPLLVLMLSFTDSMHLVYALRAGLHDGLGRSAAISRSLRLVGPACALTSVTTALAFLTLSSSYGALTELALFGSAGVLLAYVAVIAVFPVAVRVLGPDRNDGTVLPDEIGSHAFDGLAGFVSRRPRAILIVSAAVVAFGLLGHLTTQAKFGTYDHLPDNSEIPRASLVAESKFGGVFNVWTGIDGDPQLLSTTPDGWQRLETMHATLEDINGEGTVFSPVALARALGRAGPLTNEDLARLPDNALDLFGGRTGLRTYVGVLVGDLDHDPAAGERFDRMVDAARLAGATSIAGTPVLARYDGRQMIATLNLSLLGAAFATIGCILIAFRTIRLMPALTLANVLPILLAGAGLHLYAEGGLNMTTAVCLTIAFGVAVDNSIHFLNRVNIEHGEGLSRRESVLGAIRHVGIVLFATSVILAAGVALTALSAFSNVRLFGLMFDIVLVVALVGSLVVLPAGMLAWHGWERDRR
ncbi:MAG: RND family transporter [Rhizobiaceae bacterium]